MERSRSIPERIPKVLTQQFLEIRENLKIALLNEALIKNPESQTKLKAMNPIHMILVGGGESIKYLTRNWNWNWLTFTAGNDLMEYLI